MLETVKPANSLAPKETLDLNEVVLVSHSIQRYPNRSPIVYLAAGAKVVQYGFMTAGVTVSSFAALQSLVIVAGWLRAL
jgi:hypothetical protein